MATKKDLEELLTVKFPELTKDDISFSIDTVLSDIQKELEANNRIEVRGFGTLSVRKRPARVGRDPRKNEVINIPEKKTIYYRMAKGAFEKLNEKQSEKINSSVVSQKHELETS